MDSNENMESVGKAKWLMYVWVSAQSLACHTCPPLLNSQNLHNPFEFSLFLYEHSVIGFFSRKIS